MQDRLNIVFFQANAGYGGSQRCMLELAGELADRAKVTVVDAFGDSPDFVDAAHAGGLDLRIVQPGGRNPVVGESKSMPRRLLRVAGLAHRFLRLRAQVGRLIPQLKPSLICCYDLRSAWLASRAVIATGAPLVVYFHRWYTPDMLPNYGRKILRRHACTMLAVSHQTKTALMCSGLDPARIHVVHNPVDVPGMEKLAARPLEAPLPQADRPVRILLAASIEELKGHLVAVRALRKMLDAGYDAVLWLAGSVTVESYGRQLRCLIEQSGLVDRVVFLGQRHDMPQVMAASTCLILPSRSEGHPRVLLEAMSLAKPVAATPVGGNLDMVFPNMTGQLFDVGDADGLAQCLARYAADPAWARQIALRSQEYVRLSFTPQQHLEKLWSIFTGLARGAGGEQRPGAVLFRLRRWILLCLVLSSVAAVVASHSPQENLPELPLNGKILHVLGFLGLSSLMALLLAAYGKTSLWHGLLVLLIMTIYAACDEGTQPYFHRQGSVWDWLLDTAAAAGALVLWHGCAFLLRAITWRMRRQRKSRRQARRYLEASYRQPPYRYVDPESIKPVAKPGPGDN